MKRVPEGLTNENTSPRPSKKEAVEIETPEKGFFSHNGRSRLWYYGRVKTSPAVSGMLLIEGASPGLLEFVPKDDSPQQIIPVNGTTATTPRQETYLKFALLLGPWKMYSHDLKTTPIKVAITTDNMSEDANSLLKNTNQKYVCAWFSMTGIKEVARIKKRQGNRRKTSQNKAMAGSFDVELEDGTTVEKRISEGNASANKIAALKGIKKRGLQFEWTHLIAYRFVGERGQLAENLVLATKECNTVMMFFENAIVDLIKHYTSDDSHVELKVIADTFEDGYTAKNIYYHIKVPVLGFDLTVKFDARITVTSTTNYENAVSAIFKHALDRAMKGGEPVVHCTPLEDVVARMSKEHKKSLQSLELTTPIKRESTQAEEEDNAVTTPQSEKDSTIRQLDFKW